MTEAHSISSGPRKFRFGTTRRVFNEVNDLYYVLTRIFFPIIDLILRLWIGQFFLVRGIIALANLEATTVSLHASTIGGDVDSTAFAFIVASIEVLGGLLLILGLGARFAAMMLIAAILWLNFPQFGLGIDFFQLALIGWFIVAGAGPIALDRMVGGGLAESALIFAKPISRICKLLSSLVVPIYLAGFRLLLAGNFLVWGLGTAEGASNKIHQFLSQNYWVIEMPGAGTSSFGLILITLAAIIAIGLATRLTAIFLLVVTFLFGQFFVLDAVNLQWAAMLGLLVSLGPGRFSVDRLFWKSLCGRFPELVGKAPFPVNELPHVVVVGAGFGGISAVRALRYTPCRITLIDRNNYHLFQPLLYQVATGGLSPADIATPIRSLLRKQGNVTVLMDQVLQIDREAAAVILDSDRRINFDYLIIATGARHGYFGRDDEWKNLAPGLKKIEDATEFRRRLLLAFERAENTDDVTLRQDYLTFVIVGGGPTGVELAGAMAELARHGFKGEYRNIDPATARIVLVQSGERILPTFPKKLSQRARRSLERLGVEVRVNSLVAEIDEDGVVIASTTLRAKTVFWAAGVIASPAGRWLAADTDTAGRVKVEPDLSIPGFPNIFAVGDTVTSLGWNGNAVPGLAAAAKQGGIHAARVVHASLEGRPHPGHFVYKHAGNLATIGRQTAVADLNLVRFSGALAWWFWGLVHIFFLAGGRTRVAVMMQWAWAYITYRGGMRLITGQSN